METITIQTEFIQLDKLLKWANVASTGGEAKILIQNGDVSVNGQPVTQRGKKIYPGDQITVNNKDYLVAKG